MALAFRNLTITPEAPVSEWPTEAVQAALERGDLADWHRIVAADTGRSLGEDRAASGRGAQPLTTVWRRRSHGDGCCPAPVNEPRPPNALRSPPKSGRLSSGSGLSRAEFASRIGTSASRLSTYASGKVTPSATLMLRIRRVAERRSCDEQQPHGSGTVHG